MSKKTTYEKIKSPDPHHDHYSKTLFGFWLFVLTDFVLFGTLFATYAVLGKTANYKVSTIPLFDVDYAMIQTFLMLIISFLVGLGGASVHRKDIKNTKLFWLLAAMVSLIFMTLLGLDFHRLLVTGNSYETNALLSGFYTLLGTFGLHVFLGFLWIIILLIPVFKEGIGHESILRLSCTRMFFQFLNIVWIFIYTIVYFLAREAV
jgi:cytochrome o ubiquinol oxidase subunit 3